MSASPSPLSGPALSRATGRPVEVHAELDSTNRLGRERARAWLAAGDRAAPLPVVVAEHQTAGRGRLDRRWEAAPGENLLFSVLLAPDLPLIRAPRAVLAWAAALAGVLDVGLKWPNDLVGPGDSTAPDHKLGGILAEHEPGTAGDRVGVIVLGIGLNVGQRDFPGLPTATSLARLRGSAPERGPLLVALIRALDAVDPGAADALAPWRAHSRTLGRRVRVAGREGVATGLRDDGALLVDGEPVLAGDVELVRHREGAAGHETG